MVKKLAKNILTYCIPQLIVLGVILMLIKDYVINITATTFDIRKNSDTYSSLSQLIVLIMICLYLYICYTTIRNKRYHILTNRNYVKDKAETNKTYSWLVNFYTTNDPYKIDVNTLPVADWHNAEGIILGKAKDNDNKYHLLKRPSKANGNLLCFGLPGSGKSTTQAATTAARFNADIVDGGCGVFAISIKGDLLNFVNGKRKNIKVFTPDKAEGSCHYNPLQGLSEMSQTEQRIFIENLSFIIVPEEQGDNAAYFVTGARDYFCGITHYLLYLHNIEELPEELKFNEIIDKILSTDVFEITTTIKDSECEIAGEYTNSYFGSSEKNVSGVYNQLCKNVRPFNTGALRTLFDGEGDCISPEDLNTSDIYIDVPQEKYAVYAPAMSIIITNFLSAFMNREDVSANKDVIPILFLLDEFVQLNIDFKTVLSPALSTLRSKSVSLFMLMQSIAQLEDKYGEAQAREIMDLCAYISVFNAQDPKSRKYFQDLVGKRKVIKRNMSKNVGGNNSINTGNNISIEDEYIFDAADFGDLTLINKNGTTTKRVLIYANGKYLLAETTPCYE